MEKIFLVMMIIVIWIRLRHARINYLGRQEAGQMFFSPYSAFFYNFSNSSQL